MAMIIIIRKTTKMDVVAVVVVICVLRRVCVCVCECMSFPLCYVIMVIYAIKFSRSPNEECESDTQNKSESEMLEHWRPVRTHTNTLTNILLKYQQTIISLEMSTTKTEKPKRNERTNERTRKKNMTSEKSTPNNAWTNRCIK